LSGLRFPLSLFFPIALLDLPSSFWPATLANVGGFEEKNGKGERNTKAEGCGD